MLSSFRNTECSKGKCGSSLETIDAMRSWGAPKPARWHQDKIWITFWCPPPETDKALAQTAAEHFNLTWTSAEGLNVAARHGLKVMIHDEELLKPWVLDDPTKKARLDAMIDK